MFHHKKSANTKQHINIKTEGRKYKAIENKQQNNKSEIIFVIKRQRLAE